MPDIVITPSSGIIDFFPSSSRVNRIEGSGNTLNLVNTVSPSSTLFNIEGTNGSLFSVVDNLSGTLMSVNNNAGLPVLEVFSDDKVVAGRFGQNDFVVSSGGNVGIGTDSPLGTLEVRRDITGGVGGNIIISNFSTSNNAETVLGFSNSAALDDLAYAISCVTTDGAGYLFDLNFKGGWGPYSQLSTRMTIKSNGNVGIGTSSPSQLLHVAGDINVNNNQGYRINNTATSGHYLRGNGTRFVSSGIQAADVPTLNQNTTGTAANITATSNTSLTSLANLVTVGNITTGTWNGLTIGVNRGGTGQTTYTNGELLIGNTTGNTLTKGTLTQGAGITITNGTGSITITNASPNATHTGDVTGATALTIANSVITNAKLANVAASIIKGRITTGTGVVEDLTPDQVRTIINATSTNTASAIVARDASGNFSAGTITATLSGNASTATTLQTARTIGGVSFNGSANINLPGVNTAGNQNTTGSAATLTTARTLTIGSTGKTFNGGADVSWSLSEIGAYAANNPSGYTTNTGTVTNVGGTGTVAGLTLSGTVTSTGNLILGGSLASATSAAVGGIKLGSDIVQTVSANSVSTNSFRTYAVQLNATGQAVVNVPWGNTTYTNGTGLSLSGTTFSVLYGNSSTTACVGNDSRLDNARTPTAHVLATTTGLGPEHTVSGLTTGQVLQATSATTAAFGNITRLKDGFEEFDIKSGNVTGFFIAKTQNANDGHIGIETYNSTPSRVGYAILGVRSGNGFLQGGSSTFRIEQTGGGLGNLLLLGITTNSMVIGSQASKATISYTTNTARTYTLPDAGGNADFVMTAGNQTIGGVKTFNNQVNVDNLRLDDNTLSATDTNGSLIIAPNGTGALVASTTGNTRGTNSVDLQMSRIANTQVASGTNSTIGGGVNNTASGLRSTIGGGVSNTASGASSTVGGGNANSAGSYATVGGGFVNDSSGVATTISGGLFNIASAERSTIGGGGGNNAIGDGNYSTISGGQDNTTSGTRSTIGGGRNNTASGTYSTIGGGQNNLARSNNSTVHGISNIAGGLARRANNITGATTTITALNAVTSNFSTTSNAISIRYFNNSNSTWNVVTRTASNITQSGGNVTFTVASIGATGQTWSNVTVIDTTLSDTTNGQIVNGTGSIAIATFSTVSGGNNNTASGNNSTIGGGINNTASGDSTVSGGQSNNASGGRSTVSGGILNNAIAFSSTVGGGGQNAASAVYSTVGGGQANTVSGSHSTIGGGILNNTSSFSSTIGGGFGNTAGGIYSTVGGGNQNIASGNNSTIGGGQNNLARSNNSTVHGISNIAGGLARRANNITGATTTITALNAVTSNFSTTSNAISIRYFNNSNSTWNVVTRTASNITQSSSNVTFTVASIGATGQTWSNVTVIDTTLSDTTNGQAVNGTGSIAIGTSSTVSGGNSNTARGAASTVGGGIFNTASGPQSTVSGGQSNNASGNYSKIGGGRGNAAAAYYSTIGGGAYNNVSGPRSTIGGGDRNAISSTSYGSTIGGGRSNYASGGYSTVGGGIFNTASGPQSTVGGGGEYYNGNYATGIISTISGGAGNYASGVTSTIGGGSGNAAGASYSTVGGGIGNNASGNNSTVIGGDRGKTTKYGEVAHASGGFSNQTGTAQHSILIARNITTNNTATTLFLNGSNERLVVPAQTTWTFEIKVSAYNTSDNIGAWWIIRGGIRRNNANGTTLVGNLVTENGVDGTWTNAAVAVTADDTNEALNINVTGLTSKTIRWTAVVDICQTSGAAI